MDNKYRTYVVTYKRTAFDTRRTMKVFATSADAARETVRDCEGSNVIIECAAPEAVK